MTFKTVTCVVAVCDGCQFDHWGDEDFTPHYTDVNSATADLIGQHGWRIEQQVDGATTTLCPECAKRQDCDRRGGHQWELAATETPAYAGSLEMCGHCGRTRRVGLTALEASAADHEHQWRHEPALHDAKGRVCGPYRVCEVCDRTWVLLTQPPSGHPDSLDGLLPDADEAWLAEMDASTWPDDTDWQHTLDAQARLDRSGD